MSRSLSASLLGFVLLWCLGSLPAMAGQAATGVPVNGLIVGFKNTDDEAAQRADRAPWASDRERARAVFERQGRRDRERLARVAKEVGLPQAGTSDAGAARLLHLERPLKGAALDGALRRLRLHPDVAWVEPNVRVPRLQAAPVTPNDRLFGLQWHLQAPDPVNNVSGLNLPAAWAMHTGSPVVVAVVDSGVRFDHPDLAGRLLPGYDLVGDLAVANDGNGRDADASDPGDWITYAEANDPQGTFYQCTWDGRSPAPYPAQNSVWHGTFIAGQIAAGTNNTEGVAGINWDARILPVRVSGKCGAYVSDLLDGLRWAAGLPVAGVPANPNPARVINLSFGGDAACSPAYQSTIDEVTAAGALVVVAAGNDSKALARPADCQNVMAVAAVRKDGAKASYSSFGPQVALSAPGGSSDQNPQNFLVSTDNSGTMGPQANSYGYKQGSSFAAPQAAGVASLMLGINPALTPSQLISRMQAGVRPHATPAGLGACGPGNAGVCACTTSSCGTGLLDADRALQLATGPAVVIAPIERVEPGSLVSLDGRQSVAVPGSTIVSYQWQQVQGPPVTLNAAGTPVAGTALVSEATYVFELTVRDDQGRQGVDRIVVVAAMPQLAGGGGGGGHLGLFWGLGLWAWVAGVLLSQRRRRFR